MAVYKYSRKLQGIPELNTSSDISAFDPGTGGESSSNPTPTPADDNVSKLLILAVILFALLFLFK